MSKYLWPDLPDNATEDQKKDVVAIRGKSQREATAALIAAAKKISEDETDREVFDADTLDAIAFLTAERKRMGRKGVGAGSAKETAAEKVAKLFADPERLTNGRISELDVFLATKLGRNEVQNAIKHNLKNAKPEDRQWVTFDVEAEEFVVVGHGADLPEGWTGFNPDAPKKETPVA